MFKAIAITPAFVIVVMTLASFWLPPQSGEKLLLNGIACIIICILLLYFSQLLPILAATPPLIGEHSYNEIESKSYEVDNIFILQLLSTVTHYTCYAFHS